MIHTRQKDEVRSPLPDSLDTIDLAGFSRYLYQRRKLTITASVIALALTGVASFLSPAKYTATASILIEPPAGNDPRGATAVSPVYLESLKTYEHFASSDSLFREALTHLHLREVYSGVAIESLKQRVLKVTKPKDEKILEISATLADPPKAQQFAQYIAEKTVAINRSLVSDSTRDLSGDATNLVQAARSRLENARAARDAYLVQQPVTGVQTELSGATDLKLRVDRNLTDADVELAALTARFTSQRRDNSSANGSVTRDDLDSVQAEISALRQQSQKLEKQVSTYSALLEKRKQQLEMLDKEVQAAQAQYEAAQTRRTDMLSSSAFRGERLEIIDPGVVPERPSSPNIPLNIAVALLGSVFCSVLYLALRFGYLRMHSLIR
jgi:uncharacterized protein involved in exopolysaccharide biosynthesis